MRDGLCALLQSDEALEVVAATAIRGDALADHYDRPNPNIIHYRFWRRT